MSKAGLLIFQFWTPHFVVWTPHFGWTLRFSPPSPGIDANPRDARPVRCQTRGYLHSRRTSSVLGQVPNFSCSVTEAHTCVCERLNCPAGSLADNAATSSRIFNPLIATPAPLYNYNLPSLRRRFDRRSTPIRLQFDRSTTIR